MAALPKVAPQFAQEAPGVRISRGVGVGRLPQQAHQQVAAAPRAETLLDQVSGQFPAEREVIRAEQAMMSQAQGFREQDRIRGRPGLAEHGQNRGLPAAEVVSLPRQPGADPQRKGRASIE
jgi:hypothetical protein